MQTEKSKQYLLFYLSPSGSDRAYLKTSMENFKVGKWNQLKFLLEFIQVLEYMKDVVKHQAFSSTCKSFKSRELILEYLKFIKTKHQPAWNSSVKKDSRSEYKSLGIVEFFEEKDHKRHRTSIIEACNGLMVDLITYIRTNPKVADTCLK